MMREMIFETKANHTNGLIQSAGKLEVHEDRLVFRPSRLTFGSKPIEFLFVDIAHVGRAWAFGLTPTGMQVITHDGRTATFSTRDRNKVIATVQSCIPPPQR
jgi:hypothetical protein